MPSDMKPFRMIGNLYFVGTRPASSHLLVTEEGLILIDTGYEHTADVVIEGIEELGFDVRDVKYIIHSHGHGDHSWGTPKILRLAPDAETFLSFNDIKYIKGFTPDHDINDGDVIRLGSTEIYCMFTPGHTEGACSFFFNVTEDGRTYRCGMYGGAGTNQLKKSYMHREDRNVSYLMRGKFFDSIERLKKEHVDVMVGNHVGHNHTDLKYEKMASATVNPFIDEGEWPAFLEELEKKMWNVIHADAREAFVNYAHRGAPAYCPENTLLSFYTGMQMGANGIETDVQVTKDGTLVLFHDDTLARVTGETGSVADYTYDELSRFLVSKDGISDKIPTLEDFLTHFGWRDITFAIELKVADVEERVADMIRRHGLQRKCVITSFTFDYIKKIKEYAPELRIGYLTKQITDETIERLLEIGAEEYCPEGQYVTRESTERLHRLGFNVRAWGIYDEEIMKRVYDALADGMTVNFPDKLTAYIQEKTEEK